MRVEVRILRRISGAIKEDEINYEYVRSCIGISSIVVKLSKNRLRWFGYFMKGEEFEPVREDMNINVKECKSLIEIEKQRYSMRLRFI